jgi:uncharacterized protein
MTMRIVVLSDTHIPKAAQDMPQEVYQDIGKADMVLHAGDIVEKEFLEKLMRLNETKAVYGNMDTFAVRAMLNQKEVVKAGKFKIGLIHGYGVQSDLMETVKAEFGKVDAIVFGHSHKPVNTVKDGILFFNPGSPTDKVFAEYNSYGILDIDDKKIEGKIIRL